MAYLPASGPDPDFMRNAANVSQSRRDAWNHVAEIAARLAEQEPPDESLEAKLGSAFAFLRGVEGFWVFPGLAAIDRMEELAGMGRMDELAKEVRSLAWLQGRYGDAAALADPDLGARTDPARPDRHYFTVLFVSDVDASVWDRAVDEMHTFRRPG